MHRYGPMRALPLLVLTALLAGGGGGCTTSAGRTYRSSDWSASRPLGKVLVVIPDYASDDGSARPEKDAKIRAAVREAVSRHPGVAEAALDVTLFRGDADGRGGGSEAPPLGDADLIAAARRADAQTVCLVTVGQFGGRYRLTALPPGWDARTTVQYAARVLDARSGQVLLDAVRERSAGGYLAIMTATYPNDLTTDLADVLTASR